MAVVKLFGAWTSPYIYRVIWALKLKGIPYEYIEEDLLNKRPLLLQYNPVHKKIPVLVHDGKPICESTIILQYIEEIWPQPSLLPSDPYERAMARFWIKFADDKLILLALVHMIFHCLSFQISLSLSISKMYRASGEEQEKAVKDILEMLETIEDHGLIGGKKFFGETRLAWWTWHLVQLLTGWELLKMQQG
ncbi:hypothetical protein POUND7_019398 [Theobroma cacao]